MKSWEKCQIPVSRRKNTRWYIISNTSFSGTITSMKLYYQGRQKSVKQLGWNVGSQKLSFVFSGKFSNIKWSIAREKHDDIGKRKHNSWNKFPEMTSIMQSLGSNRRFGLRSRVNFLTIIEMFSSSLLMFLTFSQYHKVFPLFC